MSFTGINESQVSEAIEKRASEMSNIPDLMMVTNSPMILKNEKNSIIGFDIKFGEYVTKTLAISGYDGKLRLNQDDNDEIKQLLTEGIARGWSIKAGNKVSEIISCIGHGSCVETKPDNHSALAALEMYGIGEMTNSGYGDVYFTGGRI